MKALVFSPAAEDGLDNIWGYSVEDWGQRQAERYIRMIQDTVIGLTDSTQPSQSAQHVRSGYRKVLVGTHVLFFKEDEHLIDVIRILHLRMDPSY
ncbi:type II toxin-antitoxin system RelE/ParE family toxin [Paraburkholderia sp. UYCP14C]|uniref:type II toxin-antitoxin system RelE/ParE family toxin n=1 Tax=Paraburkholderia sp. UYCP14C TaxID=2511130 RepID=UPI001021552C|nr:type II toxin-antitoxin system RelE/ParE family toxin [Paraburkholderia sp. UYCP14C]RZF26518.1 type II toxin-antitoxin system RelE/ParE family toxin [Paraburkholderia sp. UYCP14C]